MNILEVRKSVSGKLNKVAIETFFSFWWDYKQFQDIFGDRNDINLDKLAIHANIRLSLSISLDLVCTECYRFIHKIFIEATINTMWVLG